MKTEIHIPLADDVAAGDDIIMTNALLPGVEVVQPRASLPAWAEVGWVELKSPAASVAANPKSPDGDTSPEEAPK